MKLQDTHHPPDPLGAKHPSDIVITYGSRTPLTKAKKGGLSDTSLEYLLFTLLKDIRRRSHFDTDLVDDICLGNVGDVKAAHKVRAAALAAGFAHTTSAKSVNRFCGSGLAAVADIAQSIACGAIEVGIAMGGESMSSRTGDSTGPGWCDDRVTSQSQEAADSAMPMGWTSENVADEYGISREDMDAYAAESQGRAFRAQRAKLFEDEIVQVPTTIINGQGVAEEIVVAADDGIRPGSSVDTLSKLRPAFPQWGERSTGGNSSQLTDGAAAVVLMKRSTATRLGQPILARYIASTVIGVPPRVMGIGPCFAIPKLLRLVDLTMEDIDIFEINEAFASMAVHCRDTLQLEAAKMNPRGGAIALGHPLGATGIRMIVTGISEARMRKARNVIVSMCLGTGMGMAGLIQID